MASPTIQHTTSEGIAVTVFGELDARQREILTDEALEFLGYLHTKQNAKRKELLAARTDARAKVAAGEQLDFEKSTRTIREDDSWRVAPLAPGTKRPARGNYRSSRSKNDHQCTKFWCQVLVGRLRRCLVTLLVQHDQRASESFRCYPPRHRFHF